MQILICSLYFYDKALAMFLLQKEKIKNGLDHHACTDTAIIQVATTFFE